MEYNRSSGNHNIIIGHDPYSYQQAFYGVSLTQTGNSSTDGIRPEREPIPKDEDIYYSLI